MDLYAGFDYRLRENLSLGFGFNSVDLNVDVTRNRYKGSLDWRYSGGLVFLKFNF